MTLLQCNAWRYKPRALFIAVQHSRHSPCPTALPPQPASRLCPQVTATRQQRPGFGRLRIGSIGVVYGDIGTSPLYAFREAISAATGSGNTANEPVVLGILSLIIWALLLVVTAKYVLILLRADNKGEGGTLALMALASHSLMRRGGTIILLGIISGALFYGDAIITPALVCAFGNRRLEDRNTDIRCLCCAAHCRCPDCSLCRSVARHRKCCDVLWSGDDAVVRSNCRCRYLACRPQSNRISCIQPRIRR